MEKLLYYVWRHRLFGSSALETTDGKHVEVIDPGLMNRNSGPDFFNAKIKIDGTLWVGNVEIHCKSSDWLLHTHQLDEAYDNVVLHVVETADVSVSTKSGRNIPTVEIAVPEAVRENYVELLRTDSYPPCYEIIDTLPSLMIHSWLNTLTTARLERKTEAIKHRVDILEGDWAAAYFITLARNFGFGVNSDAFEQWAMQIPLYQVAHHRDNEFQVEAIFMGQAGLLNLSSMQNRHAEVAKSDEFFLKMQSEYAYLQHKFSLQPIPASVWRFLRLRPQNFPHVRISQLAQLYCSRQAELSSFIEIDDLKTLKETFRVAPSSYWTTHYLFGAPSKQSDKLLSQSSLNLILINTVIPMLFAYGKHLHRDDLIDRSFRFLEQIKAENNHIVRMWKQCGLSVETAGDSQALIQLKNEYCDRRDCLRCRIGYEYLKKSN